MQKEKNPDVFSNKFTQECGQISGINKEGEIGSTWEFEYMLVPSQSI